MRKAKILFIAVMVISLLVGCSGGNKKDSSNNSTNNNNKENQQTVKKDPVTVKFWSSMRGGMGEVQQSIIDDFNNSQDEVIVEVLFQGNYYDMGAKLQAAVASGDVPHIAQLEMSRIKLFDEAGALADMKPYINKNNIDLNDFVEGLMSFSYVDDRIVSLPFNRSTPLFYYNKDQFKEVGLDPENPPKTWDELKEFTKKLSIPEKRWGYSVPIDTWFYEGMIMQNDGRIFNEDETGIGFDNEIGTKPLYFWKDMIKDGSMKIPPGKEYNSFEVARNDFAAGIVSMISDSTGALRLHQDTCEFEVGTAFLPKDSRYGVPTGGANVIMMSGHPKEEEEAAWKFVEFLTNTENVAKWAKGTGYLPARKSSIESDDFKNYLKENPNAQTAIDQLEYTDIPRPFHDKFTEIHFVTIMDAIQKCILVDNYTPEQAVADIAKEAKELLSE
jgi:sn-glycerol 3-phosphate transport system substrate-binding protein